MNDLNQVLRSQNMETSEAVIGGVPCTIGYIKEFRWSWLATQLNCFIIVGETDTMIDKKCIENFSANCLKYALDNHKGWMRGIQSGVGSIAILKGNNVDDHAIKFCQHPSKTHFAAFEIPIIYNTSTKQTYKYISKPLWGRIYFPYFTKTIDAIINKF